MDMDCPGTDARGCRLTPVNTPGAKRGIPPPNAGRRFPAEVLTGEEVQSLLQACGAGACSARHRAMIVLMWRCGLRSDEVLALDMRDIDLSAGRLTVRHGKGDKRRVLGISDYTREYLSVWLAERAFAGGNPTGPVFCVLQGVTAGRRLGAPYWRSKMTALGHAAQIEKRVHSHGLRHTFAVTLMRRGVSLDVISRALGHSSLTMTEHYLRHLDPQRVVAAMRDW